MCKVIEKRVIDAHLVNHSVPGNHHIFIHLTCKILKASDVGDYITFPGNLLRYFSVFVSRTYTRVYIYTYEYDHTSRQLKTPSQHLKAPLLLVCSGLREQLILLINAAFLHV